MMANLVAETYADNLEYLNQANMRYLNPSLIFFGKLSTINTSIPKLACRQSLAKLEREAPHPYLPWGAEVDYKQRPDVLRVLLLQVYWQDTSCFFKSLPISDKHDESNLEDWPMFFSKEEQQQMTERWLAGWTNYISMDSILANAVHVAPWWGPTLCCWCVGIVVMSGIQDLIGHIVLVHRVMQEGIFSCPNSVSACLQYRDLEIVGEPLETAPRPGERLPGHAERDHLPCTVCLGHQPVSSRGHDDPPEHRHA